MSNKHGAVGVRDLDTGEVRICAGADPGANYSTLCGNSLDDDTMEQVPISDRARINCDGCRSVWLAAKAFKASDFTKS